MPDIKLKDLYGEEQSYEDITELSIPKADGSGMAWYIQRPVDHFVLRESNYEPSGTGSIAYSGVGPMVGGEINLLMTNSAPLGGVSEHSVVVLASVVDGVERVFYYVWETLTGTEILTVTNNNTAAVTGVAQPGWNLVEHVDGVDTLRHIDDPESVTISVPQPCTVWDEETFYSLLSPAGQGEKKLTLTENGTVEILPEPGSRGLRRVTVTVDAEGASAGGVEWKSWAMVNGQCAVTAEDFQTYFASENSAVMVGVLNAAPLGVEQTMALPRTVYGMTGDTVGMCFVMPSYGTNIVTGALTSYSTSNYLTVKVSAAGDGGYNMNVMYVCMNDMDVTAYITASAVPQIIYATAAPSN